MLPASEARKIAIELGIDADDDYIAKFYFHRVIDSEATFGDAMEKVNQDVEKRNQQINEFWDAKIADARMAGMPTGELIAEKIKAQVIPDYSPENLIKHGGKNVYRKEIWVEIKRVGARDSKSHKATDMHKAQFAQAWAQFEEENHEDLRRQQREEIQTGPVRQQDRPPGFIDRSGTIGIDFTPTEISFDYKWNG